MIDNTLVPELFQGHLSLERYGELVKPWRLPHDCKRLFPSPDEGLLGRAETTSGVRLRCATASQSLKLSFSALPPDQQGGGRSSYFFDATIDGKIVASVPVRAGSSETVFEGLPSGHKVVDLWLPQEIPVSVSGLASDDGAPAAAIKDKRPKWITYGSSLTHCVRAHSPARTWPAIVARRRGLSVTNLGFGGQCHVDAQVGMAIAEREADIITLKLGINCISAGSLGPRGFPAAVLSLVRIIRTGHPIIPIGLISPIGYPPHETTPNAVGYTICDMRRDIADVHRRLVEMGDVNLHYFDGLEVFDLHLIAQYAKDACHPDGDGIEVMADNFDRVVMSPLLGR